MVTQLQKRIKHVGWLLAGVLVNKGINIGNKLGRKTK